MMKTTPKRAMKSSPIGGVGAGIMKGLGKVGRSLAMAQPAGAMKKAMPMMGAKPMKSPFKKR